LTGAVPVAPVFDVAEALESGYVAERGDVVEYTRPDGPPVRMVANPIRSPGTELPLRAGPRLGADTDTMLGSIGYTAERIAALRAAGAIG
jgi:crotonobetainyl-CoA:carnitine CoA-transferase CaiB-like acyl-CoA transferase